jgi:hypothetical protein
MREQRTIAKLYLESARDETGASHDLVEVEGGPSSEAALGIE